MTDPAFELAAAIIARMKANETISTLCGTRVYERPPDGTVPTPYISMGPWDIVTDDADCIDGALVTLQIDCWSLGGGEAFSRKEAATLAAAVRSELHQAEFSLSDNALATINHRITRYQRESDGATNRAIVTIEAFVELP